MFQQHWAWAVIGAGAIVLAAMYMLRAISAVLHQDVGSTVSDAALDLRAGELAIVTPLVALLLVLSAWPAAISDHAFGGNRARQQVTEQLVPPPASEASLDRDAGRRLVRALAGARAARGDGSLPDGGRVRPSGRRRAAAAFVCAAGFIAAFTVAIVLFDRTDEAQTVIGDAIVRDRWGALAQILIAGSGLVAVLISYRERMRDEHVAEHYALLAAAGAGMCSSSRPTT